MLLKLGGWLVGSCGCGINVCMGNVGFLVKIDMNTDRLLTLKAWQKHYGMVPREDSKLTDLFVAGHLPGISAAEVARELVVTDVIYKQTLYGDVIETFLRKLAIALRNAYPCLTWKSTWDIVKFYGPIGLKLMCVSRFNVIFPNLSLVNEYAFPESFPGGLPCEKKDDVDETISA